MKKRTPLKKVMLAAAAAAALVPVGIFSWLVWTAFSLPSVDFLRAPSATLAINVLDWDGGSHPFTVGPRNADWIPLAEIPDSLRDAVVSAEDFSFFTHKGVDWFELREAIRLDLAKRRFVRGASTITQQLAKNLFLSRDRTVARKVREMLLARQLERTLSKERILELYLNVVEFGPMVYGARAAAEYYFQKEPGELTIRESSLLAAVLPGPKFYDPHKRFERVVERSDRVLRVMLKGRHISEEQYNSALAEIPSLSGMAAAALPPTTNEAALSNMADAEPPEAESDPLSAAEELVMSGTFAPVPSSLMPDVSPGEEVHGQDADGGDDPSSRKVTPSATSPGGEIQVSGKTVFSGAGLEDAAITVQRQESGNWTTFGETRSGYHGDFVFRAPPGLYRLSAEAVIRMDDGEVTLRGYSDGLKLELADRRLDRVVVILLPSP